MTRAIVATLFIASLQVAAPAPAAAASLCSIGTAGIVPLPNGTTYALVLTSPSEAPVTISFDLHSPLSDYATSPTTIAFKPITAAETKALQTPAHFISAPVFVSLPKFDTVLIARASTPNDKTEACTPHATLTTFYFRRDDANYQPSAAWVDWRQRIVASYAPDAPLITAAEVPFEGARCLEHANTGIRMTSEFHPGYPRIALSEHDSGVTFMDIAVDEGGNFAGATLVASAGNPAIDGAAIDAAKASKYSPAVYHCIAVPGILHFRATFVDRPLLR
jgi:TonB family protein